MTSQTNAFLLFLFLLAAFTHVASWTIDLPEVRKFLFEKNEKYKKYGKNEYDDYLSGDQKFYSNIEGNSKHNSKDYLHEHHIYDKEKYAEEYGYHSYMEKKVLNIVRDGSTYLEGLQRSLEEYNAFLENCNNQTSRQNTTSANTTVWRPEYDPPQNSSELPAINTNDTKPLLNFDNYDNSTVPRKSNSQDTRRPSGRGGRRMTCQEATKASEQVRRFADLALWATKRLQDIAYAKKYEKTDEQEENELILKLAWFLDRLAYLSGYEPVNKEYEPRETTSTTTAPEAQTLVPSSNELTQEMMDCLRRNSSEPATERCRYPMQIPDLTAQIFNISGTTPSSSLSSESNNVLPMNTPTDNIAVQSSEILVTGDNSSPNIFSPKSLTKRSTEYTYYYPPKPLHELNYPAPVLKLIKHRLSNIKAVVKNIVERRLAHIAEKKEDKQHFEKHFEKRSINDVATSNSIVKLSNPKLTGNSIEKKPLHEIGASIGLIHYPVSDVSIINTKSFRKRSVEHRITSNHLDRTSNLNSFVKSVKKGLIRKKFEHFQMSKTMLSRLSKHLDSGVKSIKKRYTEDPMTKLANYYMKFKIWDASNPKTKKSSTKKAAIFEINNDLNEAKIISKRSLFNKKVIHMHVPKPLQIVRTYVNGHRHHLHGNHKPKLLTHLQKLHDLKHKKVAKIHKNIQKRSLHYGDKYLPRIPMDPQGDISYYIKNKEGTEYNPSLVQAGQVRLGLEQIFQIGNIEVVRRFGSNYNPLNPAPFYSGVMASMADT